jgi:hypothetical protein
LDVRELGRRGQASSVKERYSGKKCLAASLRGKSINLSIFK